MLIGILVLLFSSMAKALDVDCTLTVMKKNLTHQGWSFQLAGLTTQDKPCSIGIETLSQSSDEYHEELPQEVHFETSLSYTGWVYILVPTHNTTRQKARVTQPSEIESLQPLLQAKVGEKFVIRYISQHSQRDSDSVQATEINEYIKFYPYQKNPTVAYRNQTPFYRLNLRSTIEFDERKKVTYQDYDRD